MILDDLAFSFFRLGTAAVPNKWFKKQKQKIVQNNLLNVSQCLSILGYLHGH
jgi:hypothetical protein